MGDSKPSYELNAVPPKDMRIQGKVYEVTPGVFRVWKNTRFERICRSCRQRRCSFKDKEGKIDLCAPCAKTQGIYKLSRPCVVCHKYQSSQNDEFGTPFRLCAGCARERGTHSCINPCKMCSEDSKKEANYPDANGNSKMFCAKCARKSGCYVKKPVHHPFCEVCIEIGEKDPALACVKMDSLRRLSHCRRHARMHGWKPVRKLDEAIDFVAPDACMLSPDASARAGPAQRPQWRKTATQFKKKGVLPNCRAQSAHKDFFF